MIETANIGKISDYVYDISLDGTVIDAFSLLTLKNTDGFNFKMPGTFRYTEENPYIGKGLNRDVKEGEKYIGVVADVMEFDDLFMRSKMGMGIDEYARSTINLSRKNYLDYLEDGKTKKVGNTIKSKKMPGYIEKFIDKAGDLLLFGKGDEFLEYYYEYIEKIYNYKIPLKDIASKGKIKKTLKQYKEDCKSVTKAGAKKSRQAWYELLLLEKNPHVDLGDTIYYINTGDKKGDSDVKRVTKYYQYKEDEGKKDITKDLNREFNKYKKLSKELIDKIEKNIELDENEKGLIDKYLIFDKAKHKYNLKYSKLEVFIPEANNSYITSELAREIFGEEEIKSEDDIILNCVLLDRNIVESDDEHFCGDGIEYNVIKYIEMFNSRIKPLLVCFSSKIRDFILVKNPDDRRYFTKEEAELCSGEPFKPTDQDSYEELMSLDRREVEFWLSINQEPPFLKECGMDWEEIKAKYFEKLKLENNDKYKELDNKYQLCLDNLTEDEIDKFLNEGEIPASLQKLVYIKEDSDDLRFYFKDLEDMTPSTGGYIFDDISMDLIYKKNEAEFEENISKKE